MSNENLKLLKEQIYVDERIEELLEALGCGQIEYRNGLWTASLPDGDNSRSVQIKNNESLTTNIRSRGLPTTDVYGLVGYIEYRYETFDEIKKHLHEIKNWVCNVLDYPQFRSGKITHKDQSDDKIDYNFWLRDVQRRRKQSETKKEIKPNKIRNESILREFRTPRPNEWWKADGIDYKTQIEFEVGFDILTERITFAVRNSNGKLIGVKGRYVGQDKRTMKEQKYMYVYRCNKSLELFNFHRALPYILESKEVIIVEGAKTTMLGWQYNIRNIVSSEGDALTEHQIKLLKDLGVDVRIVLAYDKDKDAKFVKKQAKMITERSVFTLFDTKDIFEGKQSPMDKGLKSWNRLYNECKYKIN